MYLTLAKAGKEVALARRQMEMAKAATAEAQAVIWEKNALELMTTKLENELNETKRKLGITKEALAEAEWTKVKEIVTTCTKAVEEYKASNKFWDLVLNEIVDE